MPYSSVSEIDAGDLPSRSSFNTSFPTPVRYFVMLLLPLSFALIINSISLRVVIIKH